MAETGVINGRPVDEPQYGAEKEPNDTSSSRSTAQELEGAPQPKDERPASPRPVHGIKVCSDLCLLIQETIEAGHALTCRTVGSRLHFPYCVGPFVFHGQHHCGRHPAVHHQRLRTHRQAAMDWARLPSRRHDGSSRVSQPTYTHTHTYISTSRVQWLTGPCPHQGPSVRHFKHQDHVLGQRGTLRVGQHRLRSRP